MPSKKAKPAGGSGANGEAPRLMTAEEFIALPERKDGCSYELEKGILVARHPVPWAPAIHSFIQGNLLYHIRLWMDKFGHGAVAAGLPCLLSENPDTVRKPDVAVLLQADDVKKAVRSGMRTAPDIVIELLSPSNEPEQIREKARDYFEMGTHRLWIAEPGSSTVVIHKADGANAVFVEEDMLEDPEVLPGFSLALEKVFDPLSR